ncbi:MAG: glycosyltransferase family 9 protein [Verrucomicrobiota bacterium]|jgi:lipopolysaccharide heptosyltransferase I|nr:glycosyltransferase family 9 protein [Verrucomicrobiota bacterium]
MKKILIVKLSSLGDIAHALWPVHVLKVRTGAEIDWVVQPEYASLLAAFPDVRRVVPFPRRHAIRHGLPFLRNLRQQRYDLIVDLQGLLKSAWVGRVARGVWRVGPAWAREGAPLLYHAQVARREGPRRHATDELMDVVDSIAPPEPEEAIPPLVLDVPPDAQEEPGPHVALAPFSRWGTKDWPVEKFVQLGRRLATEMGCRLSIIGGAEDMEKGEELARRIGETTWNACGRTNLPALCSLLKSMDVVVSVDSGPLHWADAMGVPVVAVYGATDPARTGPWRQLDHVVVKEGLACRPCHSRICARGDLACLTTLDVDTVFRAVMARL